MASDNEQCSLYEIVFLFSYSKNRTARTRHDSLMHWSSGGNSLASCIEDCHMHGMFGAWDACI